jgi:hypothetical protein
MKQKKTSIIGLACVIGLFLMASTAQAQFQTVTHVYAAKFICGIQKDPSIQIMPDVQAGHYSSKINVHNNSGFTIQFRKKVILLKGGQVPIEPQFKKIEALKSDWAMEVVCRDIYGHLGIALPPDPTVPYPPYIEGFVIFEVFWGQVPTNLPDDPLDVAGVYTYRAEPAGTDAVALDITVFPVKRNRYPLQ